MRALSRRDFIKTAAAGGIAAVLSGCRAGSRRTGGAERPNIVYIVADDLGYGDLGCYGQKDIRTPNLNRMAAEGMIFIQHYSGSTVCAPSRSCLMTGLHTGHTPVRGNKEYQPEGQHPLPADAVTVAEVLKREGYTTGAFGKWGLGYPGSEGDPNNQGFDEFFGYNCQRYA
ncbi:MAG: twin-arginine translocation signal domain-containing protein, partial [Planctomycetota bacterium]